MLPNHVTIDLKDCTAEGTILNLSGKEKGEDARNLFHIDELDKSEQDVTVVIPNSLHGISSSFFLGLFSKSVRKYGSIDNFFQKYKFDAPPTLLRQIESGVRHSLMDKKPFSVN